MTKLILDPCLFEIPSDMPIEEQQNHFFFLKRTIDFVYECLDSSMDEYSGAPYCFFLGDPFQRPPITKSLSIRNGFSAIEKKIYKMMAVGEYVDLTADAITVCPFKFELDTITAEPFKQYLHKLFFAEKTNTSGCLLLLSLKNADLSPIVLLGDGKTEVMVDAVSDPACDCGGIIGNYLKESDDLSGLFPRKFACYLLNDVFKTAIDEKGLDKNEKRALFILLGNEVASRNAYAKRADISRKNPSYEVFVHTNGTHFLSIDLEHGGLEIFKNQGQHPLHLGEFDYSCNMNKAPDPTTHKLIV